MKLYKSGSMVILWVVTLQQEGPWFKAKPEGLPLIVEIPIQHLQFYWVENCNQCGLSETVHVLIKCE